MQGQALIPLGRTYYLQLLINVTMDSYNKRAMRYCPFDFKKLIIPTVIFATQYFIQARIGIPSLPLSHPTLHCKLEWGQSELNLAKLLLQWNTQMKSFVNITEYINFGNGIDSVEKAHKTQSEVCTIVQTHLYTKRAIWLPSIIC